ncbi:pyridoxamine 5'-phosphate oxidase [Allonocardiopsis opalescens]|uniref:Pyridoxine/pyridoxamine 5'-phosphate oxidase n=1 Tax=Allonocardiopsis opalescens TaxID=1144618 RepID=A0A2T0QA20_9ACTN|nr:pyridoxamine 5'-phosphate oxidase [Allonocardiopsis opalescens]PRY00641.1 pyridoxamine 5'-phosphate oxidase [Allonocardiopsis opalescens]
MNRLNPAEQRESYRGTGLEPCDLSPDPIEQFRRWYADAADAGLPEVNAMVLATAGADGVPTARTVLLKGLDERGLTFYTNLTSRKARALAENPRASLLFPWHAMGRQVGFGGRVEYLTPQENTRYFASRPHGSQIGAWASEHQSSPVPSRQVLEERYERYAQRWPEGSTVPRPDYWGGYRVLPDEAEFWQGGADRMHDRIRYRREGDGWLRERLSP